MTKIILCGCFGRMGRVITDLVSGRDDCAIVAGVDLKSDVASYPTYTSIADVEEEADVILDFSHPTLLTDALGYSAAHGALPLVLCATGYSAEQVSALKEASKIQPIFYSRNMSLGINLLIELSKKAAKVLGDGFDIEIIEKHHNQKIDAPSGTALMLADAIASVRDGESEYMYDRHSQRKKRDKAEIGIHSVRGGTIVGEHEVVFAGNHEVITLSHSAQSRELFATGAISAVLYMSGKAPGLYDMSDMI